MATNHQQAILTAMMHPGFYPHPVDTITRRETHISTVFLTGSNVYKIKKPVDLGFLDFTTLDKRERCCRQEVLLNRRLSMGIYLEVVPITFGQGSYTLDGPGEAVEFAVRMRQLADEDAMLPRLQKNTLAGEQLDALADRLVAFYASGPSLTPPQESGKPAWEENLQVVEKFAGEVIDRRQFEFVRTASQTFAHRNQRLFAQRILEGRITDGHGDLRTDHIYYTPEGIQIIDCIEFNDRLRLLDVISDLSFLVMDLEYHHFPHQARNLIRRYILRTEDVGALPLLDFYCCYRALVRCKVNCFRSREIGIDETRRQSVQAAARRYMKLAHAYTAAFSQLRLWIVCGLPASGKSTLAKALSAIYDIAVIRSDVVRKELFRDRVDPSAATAFETGLYSAHATEKTYRQMFSLARDGLQKGRSVVIDATFSREAHRREAIHLAKLEHASPVFVECRAGDAILAQRLRKRETQPSVSDARLVHLEAFKKRFTPFDRLDGALHVPIETDNSPSDCLRQLLLNDSLWRGLPTKGGTHV